MLGSQVDFYFQIECQTTLQVEEEPFHRLSAKISVKLRCKCCGQILGTLYGYWATKELCGNVNFTTDTKVKTLSFLHHITHKMDPLRAKFQNSCGCERKDIAVLN